MPPASAGLRTRQRGLRLGASLVAGKYQKPQRLDLLLSEIPSGCCWGWGPASTAPSLCFQDRLGEGDPLAAGPGVLRRSGSVSSVRSLPQRASRMGREETGLEALPPASRHRSGGVEKLTQSSRKSTEE